MRLLILSDIHANRSALRAVLADAAPFDGIINLGDTFGYGPDPLGCVADLWAYATTSTSLLGNHDLACLIPETARGFNASAQRAIARHHALLTPTLTVWLELLAAYAQLGRSITLAHASPREPVSEYLETRAQAEENFAYFATQVCFVGHTHQPLVARTGTDGPIELTHPLADTIVAIEAERRYIINPGSVGQPRDGDARAAYAILDNSALNVQFCRVAYDVEQTMSALRALGASKEEAQRLRDGA